MGKIDISSLLTSKYVNFVRFVAEKNKANLLMVYSTIILMMGDFIGLGIGQEFFISYEIGNLT